jgi:hypothetical protein
MPHALINSNIGNVFTKFRFLPFVLLLNLVVPAHSPWLLDMFYIHPITAVSSIVLREPHIYLTVKSSSGISYNDYLIINPSVLNNDDYFRVGSGLGYRRHLNDEEFYYWQLMPSVHYLKYSTSDSGPMINVLGYVGVSKKAIMFLDAGIGYKWDFAKKNHGLAFDINFGLACYICAIPFM